MKRLFTKHPYNWVPIGSMADLDAATLEEFKAFNKKYYTPNNAALVIAGDIEIEKTKKLVEQYFAEVPSGQASLLLIDKCFHHLFSQGLDNPFYIRD